MVELYLDKLNDLLAPTDDHDPNARKPKLELREDQDTKMINIINVQTLPVNSLQEANEIYEYGIMQRKTAHTAMNEASSRSHFIFTIIVTTTNLSTNKQSRAKLSFVDLAGSEKVKKSNPSPAQLKEGIAINKGLGALKEVIMKLSQENGAGAHVNYRDNLLTKLMRDSIGGNSKTLMFVNISPADYNSQESYMSLFYGSSAKQIKNDVRQNVESQEVTKLKYELEQLKRQLSQYTGQSIHAPMYSSMQEVRQNSNLTSPPLMIREGQEDSKNNKYDQSATNHTLRTTTSTMAVNRSNNNVTH